MDEHLKRSLDELEIQPDIRSFHEVMRKMEEKKKRRLFIIFFWGGIMLFCVSAVSLYSSFSKQKNIALTPSASTKTSTSISNATPSSKENSTGQLKQDTGIVSSTEKTSGLHSTSVIKETNNETKNNPAETSYLKPIKNKNNLVTYNSSTKKNNTGFTTKNTFTVITKDQKIPGDIAVQTEDLLFLPPINSQLPIDTSQKELVFTLPDTTTHLAVSTPDSLKDQKKKFRFYAGISLDPKLTSAVFINNNNRNSVYNDGDDFAAHYLKGRRDQTTFNFSYAFGLKAGLNILEKYELFFGLGYQKFRQKEKLYDYNQKVPTPTSPSGQSAFAYDANAISAYINTFSYYYYSAEVNRIYKLSSKINYKVGFGMQVNQLRSSYCIFVAAPNLYYTTNNKYNAITKFTYSASLRSGIMFDAGKRWQFQLCPTAFYSPTSTFKKDYVIKQNPFGFSLECLVLFKF